MHQDMQYSRTGLALTEKFEGCELTAYQDAGAVWTNGYSNTHGVVRHSTITQAQLLRRRQAGHRRFPVHRCQPARGN